MTGAQIAAAVFDYGGVLTTPVGDSVAAWLKADRIVPGSFSATLRAWLGREAAPGTPIHRLETGQLTIAEFDALLAAELKTYDGSPVSPEGVLARLFAGMRPQEQMYTLVKDLRSVGLRVALLSNSWGNTYPRERIDALFDPVVISGEVGLRKPDPAIYEFALERLGVRASAAVFVDDATPNADGARAVGMHAIHHTDPAATRAALAALIPALASTTGGAA